MGIVCVVLVSQPAVAADRFLVMPLENLDREPSIYWLSEASAVLLADDLNALGASAITRTERVRVFDQLHLPVSAALSRATIIRVGQLAAASGVIVGSIVRDGEDLVVRAQAIRLETGRLDPEVVERGPIANLFTVFERVARRLLGTSAEGPPLETRPPLDAFESYIKGLLAESPQTQARYLEHAIKVYPRFDRARLGLWEVRTEQGHHQRALEAAQAVPPESRLSRRARFRSALSLLELGRHDDAYAAFKALNDEAVAPELQNNLGVVQLRRGGTDQTGRPTWFFTQAADVDPDDADYCFNLGYAYALEQDAAAAIYWLREAVRRDPADANAHFVLGAVLQARGSDTEAARERELARQLSAESEAPRALPKGLERLKAELDVPRLRRIETAIATPAQRDQRELAAFHLRQGRQLFQDERDREALAELRRSIYLSPYQAEAHLLVGRIHLRNGRMREAIDALKVSIWSEDTAAGRVALGEAYVKAGDKVSARAQAERALALDPESADARRLLEQTK